MLTFQTFLTFNYFKIFIFILIAAILAIVIFGLSFFISTKKPYTEKLAPYECGFDPYEDARNIFDVRFYLVALLFIVFDLEITYIFPWVLVLNSLTIQGFIAMFVFLFILTIGFLYEWIKGALDWT